MSEKKNTKSFYNSEIPGYWSTPEFGNTFSFLKSFSFSREQLTNEKTIDKIQNIHYGDIHATFENEILDFENESRIPFVKDGLLSKKEIEDEIFPLLKDGDLIIADVSEDYKGVCNCVELKNINGRKIIGGLHTFVARGDMKKISLGFRTYALINQQVVRELRRIATGISVYSVSKTNLTKVKLPLPPLPEQTAIAQLLSTWDEAITKTHALIAQKEQSKKWLMQNLLTGKKRLKGFKTKWIEYHISQLFKPIDRYVKWDDNEKYNLVSIRRRNGGMFFREPLCGSKIEVKKLKEIKSNDFLISKRQVSHGAWAIVTEKFENGKVSDEYNCLAFQDKNKVSSNFWKWYCQLPILTHYAFVDSNGVHIEKSIFDYNQFKRRIVNIPGSLAEQSIIAQVLQTADTEIQFLKKKLEMLKEQKKGLMQLLLTGKKRLKL